LSDALCALLGLRRPQAGDDERLKEKFKQVISQVNDEVVQKWAENWKVVQPIYEQTPKVLNDISKILSQEFEPNVYSVISFGRVGNVEQRLLAVIKKVAVSPEDAQKDEKGAGQQQKNALPLPTSQQYKIMRVLWI